MGETNWSCHITQIRLCLLEHRGEKRVNQHREQRHTQQSSPTGPRAGPCAGLGAHGKKTGKAKSKTIKKRKVQCFALDHTGG